MLFHRRKKEELNYKIKNFKLTKEARQRIDDEFSDDIAEDFINYDVYEEKFRHRRRRKLFFTIVLFCGLLIIINLGLLMYSGKLWFNEPRKRDYPVRGPIISERDGKVNWGNFANQNIQMCYIRATKSTAYEDKNFKKNQNGAAETDLPVGYLHVFDITMDGEDQARHFTDTTGDLTGQLVPVVEVARTGFYKILPVDYDDLSEKLCDYVNVIEQYCGRKPVIKCSKDIYENVVSKEEFDDCPVWYVSEYSKPDKNVRMDFWGYSSRVKFNYYESGGYLEMTVFNGSEEDFREMILQ